MHQYTGYSLLFFLVIHMAFSMNFDYKKILPNIKAWLTVSLIAIPLSISLAVASGWTPLQGILTAIWACVIAGFFWGSNYNIFWPAGALTALLIVFVWSTQDITTLPLLALSVALWTFIIWALRITKYIILIPGTALHGFIAWVSLTIAFGQLNNILWLSWLTKHENVLANIAESLSHIGNANLAAIGVFIWWFIFLQVWKKYIKSIPAPIPLAVIWVILWILINHNIVPLHITTLANQFPDLRFSLFDLSRWATMTKHIASFNIWLLQNLLISGFVIAIVSVLETLISAKIADRLTNTKFNQSKEVFGIAMANLFSWLAWGLPTTAVLIRTALNVKSWANSWIAAVITWVMTALISWIAFDYFKFIPMAIIAAILVNIAVGLLDFKHYRKIYYLDARQGIVLGIVAIVTFLADPIYGILIGVSISLLIYLKHTTTINIYATIFRNGAFKKKTTIEKYLKRQEEGDVLLVKFAWEITFLSINHISELIEKLDKKPIMVFSFSAVWHIDIDGLETFHDMVHGLEKQWIQYYFTWLARDIKQQFEKIWLLQKLQEENRLYYASAEALDVVLGKKE